MAVISRNECLTVVDFPFIHARFLCAEDAHQILVAPSVDDAIDLAIYAAERYPSHFAVILAIVNTFQSLVQKDRQSGKKPNHVLLQIDSGLRLVPLEFDFVA